MLDDFASLLDGRPIREIDPGVFSVLNPDTPGQLYDNRARAYDRIVGSRLYNALLWGTSPEEYRSFAREAATAGSSGWLLDAGCGTLLFTAATYAASVDRPIVAVDQSLGMLRQAGERIRALAGRRPPHIVFLQADLLDLPFASDRFATVVSMGMLHLFGDLAPVVHGLARVMEPRGRLHLSSLVTNRRIGDGYLRLLYRAGEVAEPRSATELKAKLGAYLPGLNSFWVKGNMAYARFQPS